MLRCIAWALLLMSWACLAGAHTMTLTEVTVTFATPGKLDVKIGVDLTQILGSPDRYYQFVTEPEVAQQAEVRTLLPQVLAGLQLVVGRTPLKLELKEFSTATANKALILDSQMSTLSTFRFTAALPASQEPLKLLVPIGAPIDYPVVYTLQVPAAHVSMTRWLEDGAHESEPYDWAGHAPGGAPSAHNVSVDPDSLPWTHQTALYLRLGFKHIVPEGEDHILFVLGLFFLGITWRKLLSQTTVFTIAHATTLFLSTYGIFRLPSRFVEPGIAISIAWIAIENVFKPRLGPSRLAVVFGFGLVHGLGFASSLSDIPFPKHDFIMALLGFNFGVDFGQLFVIAVAFMLVGWFRNEPWFRSRIAIPCSLVIAAIGLLWAIQRIAYYSGH
jgi:hydrogenase/urease accessory protein HupE